jgi:hypothetical protein
VGVEGTAVSGALGEDFCGSVDCRMIDGSPCAFPLVVGSDEDLDHRRWEARGCNPGRPGVICRACCVVRGGSGSPHWTEAWCCA